MKIGITGATGFLGSHLCAVLGKAGHEVRAFGRNRGKGMALEGGGACFVAVDLRDADGLAAAFRGLDLVIHAAALSAVWGKYESFYESNVVGTENVLAACRKCGVGKLVYVSSSSVYFDFKDRFSIREEDAVAKPSPSAYTRSKLEAERRIQAATGIDWIILRPRGIFGPGDTSIIPRVLRIAQRGWFPLARKGEVLVDLTYVGNLVRLVELCLTAKAGAWNQVYNVSNGEPVATGDFFDQLVEGLGLKVRKVDTAAFLIRGAATLVELAAKGLRLGEPSITRYTAGLLCCHQTLDIAKARNLLGYVPEISISEGLRRTVRAMKGDADA